MNIHQSISLSTLKPDKSKDAAIKGPLRIKASQLITDIFEKNPTMYASQSVDTYRKKWVSSRTFRKVSVPVNALATIKSGDPNEVQRVLAGANGTEVIVDTNKQGLGIGKFKPPVVVLEGAAVVQAAHLKGASRIVVWLGNLAAEAMDIYADDEMSSDELRQALQEALRNRKGNSHRPEKTARLSNMNPGAYAMECWIDTVYPFENYFIYRDGAQTFRQGYTMMDRTVALEGTPTEVELKYADKEIAASAMNKTISLYACKGMSGCSCGCDGAKKLRAKVSANEDDDESEIDYMEGEE